MDTENLIRLIHAVSDSKLTGFRYEEEGVKLHLMKKQGRIMTDLSEALQVNLPDAQKIPAAQKPEAEQKEQAASLVVSPLVGVFYAAPSEEAAPFVQVGDPVKKGQTLGIVEAMKLMNNIESDYEGTVKEILVKNGQNVEYGQPLFRIG